MENVAQLDVYAAPAADLGVEVVENVESSFFPTSITKLVVLSVVTMGLYSIYWFYKQWKYQARNMDKKIYPFARAIFNIFFTHSLFKRIQLASAERGIESNVSYTWMATLYVVLGVISWLLDVIDSTGSIEYTNLIFAAALAIVAVSMYPIIFVQKKINQINNDPDGAMNSRFSVYNYLIIVLGILFWALVMVGLFLPESYY